MVSDGYQIYPNHHTSYAGHGLIFDWTIPGVKILILLELRVFYFR